MAGAVVGSSEQGGWVMVLGTLWWILWELIWGVGHCGVVRTLSWVLLRLPLPAL